ncbi:MAG: 50S ribosomal protein L29 [Bacteroidales bacterium]
MKTSEIREMAINDLRERIPAEKAALNSMKINHAISPLEDLSQIKKKRRDIAKMITVLAQAENSEK